MILAKNPLVPSAIAQTNLALYRQMHAAGYDQAALLYMRDAYECATVLFAGHFRSTGKPFIAHLVGTASTLVSLAAAPATVAAGLLHAAYEQGEWGFTRRRESRRRRLRKAIGADAEALAWRYHELGWGGATIRRLHAGIGGLDESDRAVVLMRLANELDDQLDLAMRYVHPAKDAYRDLREVFVAMAAALDAVPLGAALIEAWRVSDAAGWAVALASGRRKSYRLAAPVTMEALRRLRRVIMPRRR